VKVGELHHRRKTPARGAQPRKLSKKQDQTEIEKERRYARVRVASY